MLPTNFDAVIYFLVALFSVLHVAVLFVSNFYETTLSFMPYFPNLLFGTIVSSFPVKYFASVSILSSIFVGVSRMFRSNSLGFFAACVEEEAVGVWLIDDTSGLPVDFKAISPKMLGMHHFRDSVRRWSPFLQQLTFLIVSWWPEIRNSESSFFCNFSFGCLQIPMDYVLRIDARNPLDELPPIPFSHSLGVERNWLEIASCKLLLKYGVIMQIRLTRCLV